jgi:predicted metallopeptidase
MSILNLTQAMELLITDIVRNVPEFSHIDPSRVLICVASTRGGGVHGTYAKIHPLKFHGGSSSVEVKRGRRTRTCTMPTVTHKGIEMLYIIYFLVPRFLNLPVREKLITVFHELYHIAPAFDGDIRRLPGRNYAHGGSRKNYNARMARLVDTYLHTVDTPDMIDFLDGDMEMLRARYRTIVARRFPTPKISVTG